MIKHIAAAAALLLASSAYAAQPGFYVGADVGQTKIDDISGHATGGGVFVGYSFHPSVAIEAGYRRIGDYDFYVGNQTGKIDLDQTHVSFVGTLPLGSNFSLLGRVGYSRLEAEAKVRGGRGKEADSGTLVGIGIGYSFAPNLSARVEFQRPASDTSHLNVGLAYHF